MIGLESVSEGLRSLSLGDYCSIFRDHVSCLVSLYCSQKEFYSLPSVVDMPAMATGGNIGSRGMLSASHVHDALSAL